MQTYTHLAMGWSVGIVIFPGDLYGQAVCVAGAVAPDVILFPRFALDKLSGKQAFVKQSLCLLTAKEVVNSIPLTFVVCLLAIMFRLPLLAFFGNWLGHLFVDALTHSGKEYEDTDPTFLWPWKRKLSIGIWEYRFAHGILKPKLLETIIFGVLVTAIAVHLLNI